MLQGLLLFFHFKSSIMKKQILSFIFANTLVFLSWQLSAQVAISTDLSAPDNSAMLDVKSSSKGMLVPRMTVAQRNAISNPANGLLIYCTDNNQYYSYKTGGAVNSWIMVSTQWNSATSTGPDIYFAGGKVGLGNSIPQYPLDVAGDINYTGSLRMNGLPVSFGVSDVTAVSPLTSTSFIGNSRNLSITQANASTSGFLSNTDWNTFNNKVSSQWSNTGPGISYSGGTVGIGTAPSGYMLTVNGTIQAASGGFAFPDGSYQSTAAHFPTGTSGQTLYNYGGNWFSNSALYNDGANIGIGTTTPGQKLTVAGTIQTTTGGVMFPDGTVQSTAAVAAVPNNIHTLGESYGGGIVFYVYDGGQHGLIAASADQSPGAQWYYNLFTTITTNAVRDGVHAGQFNTERIVISQGAGFAANICANYQGGGYGDWYLPSKSELNLLYQQKAVVGNLNNVWYWSSSENDANTAWSQTFANGLQSTDSKAANFFIRAIRAF
jgi:hypothetical protein